MTQASDGNDETGKGREKVISRILKRLLAPTIAKPNRRDHLGVLIVRQLKKGDVKTATAK